MITFLSVLVSVLSLRGSLALELIILRHQLIVLRLCKHKRHRNWSHPPVFTQNCKNIEKVAISLRRLHTLGPRDCLRARSRLPPLVPFRSRPSLEFEPVTLRHQVIALPWQACEW
jgi:hypothetical protein